MIIYYSTLYFSAILTISSKDSLLQNFSGYRPKQTKAEGTFSNFFKFFKEDLVRRILTYCNREVVIIRYTL